MIHLTSTGAEAGRTRVCLDLIFHESRGGSKGCVGCRGPAFGDILCHGCLSAPPAACFSGVWAGQIWTKIWGFSPCLAFVLVLPPMPCLSLWLAAGSQTCVVLQDLGMAQVTPDLSFLVCVCPRPYTVVPGALPFQSFLAQCSYCGFLCICVGFF